MSASPMSSPLSMGVKKTDSKTKKKVITAIQNAYLNTQIGQSADRGWQILPRESCEIAFKVKAAIRTICNLTHVVDVSGTFVSLKAYADKDDSLLDAEDRELLKAIKPALQKFQNAVDRLYLFSMDTFDEEIQEFRVSARLMEKISNILFRD
jgi:hypothetical protein